MQLHHFSASPNSRRALAAALHVGLEPEIKVVNLAAGDHKKPEYLALNPTGRVPVLVDGELVLWESNAIMQYFAEKAGNTTVWPNDPAARADVSRWQFWQTAHWSQPIGTLIYEHLLKAMYGAGTPDAAEIARAEQNFHVNAKVLEAQLRGRDWICGKNLTLADFAVGAPLMYAAAAKMPVEGYANIRQWMTRLDEVEAWKRTAPNR